MHAWDDAAHDGMSRRVFLRRTGALAAGAAIAGTSMGSAAWAGSKAAPVADLTAAPAHEWLRHIFGRVVIDGYVPEGNPQGFTPCSAARLYAYFGIAVYESLRGGMPHHRSLHGKLNRMPPMPVADKHAAIDWLSAMSAAVAGTVGPLFERTASRESVAAYHAAFLDARRAAGVGQRTIMASADHGARVAAALKPWIDADGFAQIRANPSYTPPVGEDHLWVSTPPNFGPALEPHWHKVRPFVMKRNDEVAPPTRPVPFSAVPGSAFWNQAMVPYETSKTLTNEQKWISRFWTDNPTQSGLPSGHWMLTIGQFAAQHGIGLDRAAKAYAWTGVTLADAFLSCWTEKYRSNLLRPVTYVNRYIRQSDPAAPPLDPGDPTGPRTPWVTQVNTPQFPEFTSGHSVSSLSAATVLTHLFGSHGYVDTHDLADLQAFGKTRSFGSFLDAAAEAAQSRIYGGIHYPMGIEVGSTQGEQLGHLVISRLRTR